MNSFVDFGPPTDFYEIFIVRGDTDGSSIEKFNLTPEAIKCISPAKFEVAKSHLSEQPNQLLNSEALCKIPEKVLNRKRKDCNHCLVFSGQIVQVQIRCGDKVRLIRSDILDRDIFDSNTRTPDEVSRSMQLVAKLRAATGKSPMEHKMFDMDDNQNVTSASQEKDPEVAKLAAGGYDPLFPDASAAQKPSALYLASSRPIPVPTVELIEIEPARPENLNLAFPPIARLVHLDGTVSFTADISTDGLVSNVKSVSTPAAKILANYVDATVATWKFPPSSAGQQLRGTLKFTSNCPKD